MAIELGTAQARVGHLSDAAYFAAAKQAINTATQRCLVSIFIVDPNPERDENLLVDDLLLALEGAQWRGVDTRLLVGGSHDNLAIAEACFATLSIAQLHNIPARWLTRVAGRGSHVKMLVADNLVITGSHNWSGGAFSGQIQDSVIVESAPLAIRCASLFGWQWQRADESEGDET